MKFNRHLGYLKNTSTRVVVIFSELPENKERSLVTEFDSLPPVFKDPIEKLLISREAYETDEFYKILNMHKLDETSSRTLLAELHHAHLLKAVPKEDIVFHIGQGKTIDIDTCKRIWNEYVKEKSLYPAKKVTFEDKMVEILEGGKGAIIEDTEKGETFLRTPDGYMSENENVSEQTVETLHTTNEGHSDETVSSVQNKDFYSRSDVDAKVEALHEEIRKLNEKLDMLVTKLVTTEEKTGTKTKKKN